MYLEIKQTENWRTLRNIVCRLGEINISVTFHCKPSRTVCLEVKERCPTHVWSSSTRIYRLSGWHNRSVWSQTLITASCQLCSVETVPTLIFSVHSFTSVKCFPLRAFHLLMAHHAMTSEKSKKVVGDVSELSSSAWALRRFFFHYWLGQVNKYTVIHFKNQQRKAAEIAYIWWLHHE